MQRLRQNASGKITVTARDADGLAATPSAATVTIYKPDGSALVTAAATTIATSTVSYAMSPTQTATLGLWRAVWSVTVATVVQTYTTWFEVAGGFFYELEEARTFDSNVMAVEATYPNATIVATREQIEEEIEEICAAAFVRRGRRVTLDGNGTDTILLPDMFLVSITSASIDGTALISSELADLAVNDAGELKRVNGSGWWAIGLANIVIDYVHGFPGVPEPIRRAALKLTKFRLVPTNVDDRAISHSDETGTRQLAVAGRSGPFGIPDVDATIERWSFRPPGVR